MVVAKGDADGAKKGEVAKKRRPSDIVRGVVCSLHSSSARRGPKGKSGTKASATRRERARNEHSERRESRAESAVGQCAKRIAG